MTLSKRILLAFFSLFVRHQSGPPVTQGLEQKS
jgi:hypothetical protein